jgi:hypothetical protein
MLVNQSSVLKFHLQLITDSCLEISPGVSHVILTGGYGRDEGSWYVNSNGEWQPYNDYDICIISEDRIPDKTLRLLSERLATNIEIKWVDLYQHNLRELKRLSPSIKNFDLKYASKVIFGDPMILKEIPNMSPERLSMKEALILFSTRLYTLLGCINEVGLDQYLDVESSRFFRNQMAKAILAIVDVVLLGEGAYDPSYKIRVRKFSNFIRNNDEMVELAKWALDEKLNPTSPNMSPDEVKQLYSIVHKNYLEQMFKALTLYFKTPIRSVEDISNQLKCSYHGVLKRIYWLLKFRSFKMEKQINRLLAQCYIVCAWSPAAIDARKLKRAKEILKNERFKNFEELTWDEALILSVTHR